MPVREPISLRSVNVPEKEDIDPQVEARLPKRSSRRLVLISAVICVVLAITALWAWRHEHAKTAPLFQLARVERGTIAATVSATGTCNAVVNVQVGSQVSGNIKALYADFNSVVKAGQLVALIDPVMFEAKVAQAEASWRNSKASIENARANAAKADADLAGAKAAETNQIAVIAKARAIAADAKAKLTRRIDMFHEEILAKEDLDTAQATYDEAAADLAAAQAEHDAAVHNVQSAQAALKAAETQVAMLQAQVELNLASLNQTRIDLARTRITSPVAGTVVARQMDVGQTVAASFQAPTIFQIAQDLTKMQVDTNIDESDVGRLKVGQQATFTVDAYPGTVFKGPIKQIRKAPINVQNVITYDAVVEADNPDLKLFPGMTANVSILTKSTGNALKVPNVALRFKPADSLVESDLKAAKAGRENGRMLYVPGKDSKAHAIRIEVGISDGTYSEVEPGVISEGEQVIVGMKSKPSMPPATSVPAVPRRF